MGRDQVRKAVEGSGEIWLGQNRDQDRKAVVSSRQLGFEHGASGAGRITKTPSGLRRTDALRMTRCHAPRRPKVPEVLNVVLC